jgi:L-cysteine S-thiosulfotransferase
MGGWETMRVSFGLGNFTLALALLMLTPAAHAAGQAPASSICNDTANPPKDVVTQGGCIAISRTKGNCQACHFVAGTASGNIAPPLAGMAQRFRDKARLRAQIDNPAQLNPHTIMPPFGKHVLLTSEEIDKVVEWLLTL